MTAERDSHIESEPPPRAAIGIAVCWLVMVALLLLFIGGVWVRSYWYLDRAVYNSVEFRISVTTAYGRINLAWQSPGMERGFAHVSFPVGSLRLGDSGYTRVQREQIGENLVTVVAHDLTLPLWGVTMCLAFLMLPGLAYMHRTRRSRRRRAAGLCVHCGYDLRATPERCPECGRVVERDPFEEP